MNILTLIQERSSQLFVRSHLLKYNPEVILHDHFFYCIQPFLNVVVVTYCILNINIFKAVVDLRHEKWTNHIPLHLVLSSVQSTECGSSLISPLSVWVIDRTLSGQNNLPRDSLPPSSTQQVSHNLSYVCFFMSLCTGGVYSIPHSAIRLQAALCYSSAACVRSDPCSRFSAAEKNPLICVF